MQAYLTRRSKVLLLVMTAGFVLITSALSRSAQTAMASTRLSHMEGGQQACIYDPVHQVIKPVSDNLKQSSLLTKILTGVDAFIIDISICSLGLYYVLFGRTSTFLPSIVAFYLVRTIALNIVTFPIPDFYFFEYPGFPSYFVDYDRVNDLYFSGHSGCLMIYIMDCLQNKRYKLLYIFTPFFLYTVSILLVEGIHYTNDIIIGVVCAMLISRANYIHRLQINLFLFNAIGTILAFWANLWEEFQSKVELFQGKGAYRRTGAAGDQGQKDLESSGLSCGD